MRKQRKDILAEVYKYYAAHRDLCSEQYARAEDANFATYYNTVDNVDEIHSMYAKVDVVVLTANKYEKNVLHACVRTNSKDKIIRIPILLFPQRDNQEDTYAYLFSLQGYRILHIEAQKTGSYTLGGSADITRYVINNTYLRPSSIISLGICFGIDEDKMDLGDVVISQKIYPYFMGAKVREDGYFVSDDNIFGLNSKLRGKIRSEMIDTNAFSMHGYRVVLGNYITGEAVISKRRVRDLFARTATNQTADGGEMEGYGLFKECCCNGLTIPCVIIKSICDWGAEKNSSNSELFEEVTGAKVNDDELSTIKDRIQAVAAYNACQVFIRLLEGNIFNRSVHTLMEKKLRNAFDKHNRFLPREKICSCIQECATEIVGRQYVSRDYEEMCIQNMVAEKWIDPIENAESYSITIE